MKKSLKFLPLLLTICFASNVFSQSKTKVDSIYYLLDTAKIPHHDRMWDIYQESNYKLYTILCPCLTYGTKPIFIHKIDDQGSVLTKSVNSIKLTTLPDLISKAKEAIDDRLRYKFFFIEKIKNRYILHRVVLTSPVKSEIIHDPVYSTGPGK